MTRTAFRLYEEKGNSWRIDNLPIGPIDILPFCHYARQMSLIAMSSNGRLTIPATARQALGLKGDTQLQAAIENGAIVLRPVVALLREDAWAYTPKHRDLLRKAHEDVRKGRVRKMTEKELLKLVSKDE